MKSSIPKWPRRWVGPLVVLAVTVVWGLLITTGTRAGAAAWFLFPLVIPLLGLVTLTAVLVSTLRHADAIAARTGRRYHAACG